MKIFLEMYSDAHREWRVVRSQSLAGSEKEIAETRTYIEAERNQWTALEDYRARRFRIREGAR